MSESPNEAEDDENNTEPIEESGIKLLKVKPPTTRGRKSAIKKQIIPLKKTKPGEPVPEKPAQPEEIKQSPTKDNNMPIPVTEKPKDAPKQESDFPIFQEDGVKAKGSKIIKLKPYDKNKK